MKLHPRLLLGDIAESIDYGVTASAAQQPVGPKFLRITDIQDGGVDWSQVPWCECPRREVGQSALRPGDIVFARTGATTGKSFSIRDCPDNAVFASYLIRVRLGEQADPGYVSHFFQSADYWSQITKSARGAAQPGVNATTLRSLEVPLPPLPEQRRIAAILDHAEALRVERRAALAKLDTLAQSIFIEMFGDPFSNPKGWPTMALREIASTTSGGTPDRSIQAYFEGSIPWVKSGEIHQGVVTHTSECISEAALANSAAKVLPVGTVLVAMYGATVGAVGVLGIKAATNQAICCITLGQSVASDYFVNFMKGSTTSLLAKRVGGAQPNLSQDLIRNLRIPIPPLDLQMRFAEIQKALATVRGDGEDSLDRLDGLFSSLQHRAFRGEL